MGGIFVIMLGLFLFLAVVAGGIVFGLAALFAMFKTSDEIHQERVSKGP